MSRRGLLAVVVLALWGAGLLALVRREYFRPSAERMARAGLRVSPGASYFTVEREGRQVGWASSTLDTTERAIVITDEVVTERGPDERLGIRAMVSLSRALAPTTFSFRVDDPAAPMLLSGRARGDSALELDVRMHGRSAPAQRIPTSGRAYPPTAVPLLVALGEQRRVGGRLAVTLFDPTIMGARPVVLRVTAESLFVVSDSAGFDDASGRWVSAHRDTVRAWRVQAEGEGSPLTGWVDAQGRIVEAAYPGGYLLRRTSFEEAAENWRRARGGRATAAP